MKINVTLTTLATLLCILSAVWTLLENEIIPATAFTLVGAGCVALTYKTIKEEI